MRQAPADDARQVNSTMPGPTEVLRNLTFAPLPWDTHPIDLAYGSQGWGPFNGPWTPQDFDSPFWGIDITWAAGDNAVTFGPGYDVITVMHDPSIDLVANSSLLATLERAVSGVTQRYSNTISNGTTIQASTASSDGGNTSRWAKALSALGIGGSSSVGN